MDFNKCLYELAQDVSALKATVAIFSDKLDTLAKQQWGFIAAIAGFFGKELYHLIKNAAERKKKNGNGGQNNG